MSKAVRAVVKYNPSLSGVLDVVEFAAERNGERDINPAKPRGVVETFSDPRHVQIREQVGQATFRSGRKRDSSKLSRNM